MSIQIYILSKLMDGENYPYQLKREISEPVPFDKMGNVTESKLYYHFESLTKQGLIEPTKVIHEENRPDKQYYCITAQGKEMLPIKVQQVFEKATKMSDLIIGLMFIKHIDPLTIIPLIVRKQEDLQKKLSQISVIYEQVSLPVGNTSVSVDFANDYMQDMLAREIDWFKKVIEHLYALKASEQ